MRIKSIEIERFAGIKSFKAAIAPNLQLIAGPNNACKSTILRAINFFFNFDSNRSDLLSDIQPQNDYFKNETKTKTKIKITFTDLTNEELKKYRPLLNKKRQLSVSIEVNRQNEVYYHNQKKINDQEKNKEIHELIQSSFECLYIPAIRGGNKELNKIETQQFLNTTRNFLVSKRRLHNLITTEISNSIQETHQKIEQIFTSSVKNIQNVIPESTNLSLKFPSFDEVITSILEMTKIATRDGTSLTSENEGTGFQSLLSLGLVELIADKSQSNNKLLLIEEPEAFLHPQYQRYIADQMHHISSKAQTIITTHSSVMIDQFSLSQILRISRNAEGLELNWRDQTKNIDHLNHVCDTKNSELIFSEKAILVEGRSDKLVIEAILKEQIDSSHHMKNISVIDCDGSSIEHISKLAESMGVENLIILDKDTYAGQDKKMIIKICESKNKKMSDQEVQELNNIKNSSKNIKTIKEVFELRDRANEILKSRNIFTLSSDIEGAIISSFTSQKIINYSKVDRHPHLNKDNIEELSKLKAYQFLERAYALFGSKGAKITSKNDHKPRPHKMAEILKSIGIKNAIKNSDIAKLKEIISSFISC